MIHLPRAASPMLTTAALLALGLSTTGRAVADASTDRAQAHTSAPATVKVMPLGDSMTDGDNVPGGDRTPLSRQLSPQVTGLNFVGSQQNGPETLADLAHQGHSGWRIDEVAAQVKGWLDRAAPGVVLLLIGTNDILQSRDLAGAPARLGALLDQMSTRRPNMRILIASLHPLSDDAKNSQARQDNTALPGLIKSRADLGRKITVVDAASVLTSAHLAEDGVHPNVEGHRRLADLWSRALLGKTGAAGVPGSVTLEPTPGGAVVNEAGTSGGRDVGLWASGHSTRFVVPTNLPAGAYHVRLTARADEYRGWPAVVLKRNGTQVGTVTLKSKTYAAYDLGTLPPRGGQTLEVVFTNDALGNKPGEDRNAFVDHLTLVPAQTRAVQGSARAATSTASKSRLVVSGDGRRLQEAGGQPFVYWADTAWELLHRLNRDDARQYLETRAKQGFTVIQTVALAEIDGLSTPNAQGDLPLSGRDPSRPLTTPGSNPQSAGEYDYWDHVDYVLSEAERLGLQVALLPAWGRYVNDEPIFTPSSAYGYGQWLAQRYRGRAVIWVLGGDRSPESEGHKAIWRAMAAGIEAGAGGRDAALITYHPRGGKTSAEYFHNESWLDFNMWQTGHCRNEQEAAKIVATYRRTPVKPVINAEPVYELHAVCHDVKNGYADEVDVRNVAYWSTFAGAAGHSYGHRQVWLFDGSRVGGSPAWVTALGSPGARQLGFLRNLLESRPAEGRRPDEALVRGGFEGQRPAVALRGAGYAWVYTPDGGVVTVTLGLVGASQLRASWFDPRTGQRTVVGAFAGSGERTFTPSSRGRGNDWVLLLEGM